MINIQVLFYWSFHRTTKNITSTSVWKSNTRLAVMISLNLLKKHRVMFPRQQSCTHSFHGYPTGNNQVRLKYNSLTQNLSGYNSSVLRLTVCLMRAVIIQRPCMCFKRPRRLKRRRWLWRWCHIWRPQCTKILWGRREFPIATVTVFFLFWCPFVADVMRRR